MADNQKNILNQLEDNGSVIGYKPDLTYTKERTATGEAIPDENQENLLDSGKDTTVYSKTLSSFEDNLPSKLLDDIEYVKNNIKRLQKQLAKRFREEQQQQNINPFSGENTSDNDPFAPHDHAHDHGNYPYSSDSGDLPDSDSGDQNGGNYPYYLPDSDDQNGENIPYNPYNNIDNLINNNEDNDYRKEFEDYYDRIDGSVIPALINQLDDLLGKLDSLGRNIGDLYYNFPDISVPEANKIDNSYLVEMKLREREGRNAGINYMALSYDSILNKSISMNVFRDNRNAIKVAKVIDSHDNAPATSKNMNIIKTMFAEIEDLLDTRARGYKRQNDDKMIQKSLYNYYEKRKNLNDLYNLQTKNPNNVFLGRKVQDYAEKLTESIRDVNRVLMYNQNYLDKITDLEKEKYDVQKIYKNAK